MLDIHEGSAFWQFAEAELICVRRDKGIKACAKIYPTAESCCRDREPHIPRSGLDRDP